MQSGKSKKIIRNFISTANAQLAYKELLLQYEGGTIAQLEEKQLESNLKDFKLNSKWSKSLESFLNIWSNKVMDLEDISDCTIPDDDKRQILNTTI